MLDNEKYVGRWAWNKTATRRDPRTGKRRRFPKPKSEWIIHEHDELRIIPPELWERARARRKEVGKAWPGGKGRRGFSRDQKGQQRHFPTHLLSGAMQCGTCGATMAQVSGKGGGYYGCLGAAKGACDNKMLVRRKLAERLILDALTEQLTRAEQIRHMLERVEAEVAKLSQHLPETIRAKQSELSAEERRLANFVDFIGEGRGSQALANALVETERRVEALREELEALSRSRRKVFQTPPVEWIEERLSRVQEVLERRTEQSALLLRDVLGTIRLEPRRGDVGRPYYLAETSIDCIALIETPPGAEAPDGGSNSLRQWRRRE
jgi:site-specific DNA recombinase